LRVSPADQGVTCMENLKLEPTSLASWHALMTEALQSSEITLTEDLESYLVFLLMRFTKNPEIINNILAIDYLTHVKKYRSENRQALQEVGDKCLLYAGLFPGTARKRRVPISYYIGLGQNAYASLSDNLHNSLSPLFAKLGQQFVCLIDVLHEIREMDHKGDAIDLLSAEELWNTTHSRHALRILRRATDGFILPRNAQDPEQKH